MPRGFAFSYSFIGRRSTTRPPDPFGDECPLVEASTWWGEYFSRTNGTGKVSLARLFNRGVRRIVVKGGLSRSVRRSSAAEGWTSNATARLSWTLTLTRRG